MMISGLGPHGERAAPPERVTLLPDDRAAAKAAGWRIAVVLHTLESDWARQQLSGMVGIFGDCGAAVIDVVDCAFSPELQVAELDRLVTLRPDAIISLPVANEQVAAAHRRVSEAGIKLVLLDNAPTGLLPGKDYIALVSADNFGLGKIAAEGLSPHIPNDAEVGILGFGADFFATNQREIAFTKWLQLNRPDIKPRVRRFARIEEAASTADVLFSDHPGLGGLFVVWDTPALAAAVRLTERKAIFPMATVDLGEAAAIALARGDTLCCIAAQQPLLQGIAAAQTVVLCLLGRPVPAWIALPGIVVTRGNVVETFQAVWRQPAPREVLRLLGLS
ncbi:MAG: substrate-binding domain-containing protein [Pseudotabrizicola sp.]|jgi:ribose transport system substrate-binding protein|uniref:substrate-binding domain-containing protein n=1 Tax=Pseudotabrizicola sp. TaxID=2939647 RepID=UPI00271FFD50|nr:substrate-binding domain-containing protein [Pseudotabrizicola sp.]MDO8884790.1 substrate-binding domain-containing protein [Pseudotabrizicola sp.]MDP2083229.1 substrate-binding domain-containing protein [Pseudotabrizicola sp.]MDZ7572646.1 substrate-binding domain-containing protein [Pseudotabrizicola sp.]